jgi:hypothetical protein
MFRSIRIQSSSLRSCAAGPAHYRVVVFHAPIDDGASPMGNGEMTILNKEHDQYLQELNGGGADRLSFEDSSSLALTIQPFSCIF